MYSGNVLEKQTKTISKAISKTGRVLSISLDLDFCDEISKYLEQELLKRQKINLFLPTKRAAAYIARNLKNYKSNIDFYCLGDIEDFWLRKLNIAKIYRPTETLFSADKRQFLLTQLIENYPCRWIQGEAKKPSFATAYQLAEELAYLLDQLYREQIYPVKFDELIPLSFAQHWQHHLGFLQLINEYWPKILLEQHALDKIPYQQKILQSIQLSWQNKDPGRLTVLAGSSLSQPMISDFAASIANLEKGRVVFYGSSQSTEQASDNLPIESPYYSMQKFLNKYNYKVQYLNQSKKASLLEGFFNDSQHGLHGAKETTDDLQFNLIEAHDYFQEAKSIISIVKKAQFEQKTINIITNNSSLISYLLQEADEQNISIENLTSQSINQEEIFQYLQIILDCVEMQFTPVAFLAFLKHPLNIFEQSNYAELIARLEKNYLRGPKLKPGLDALIENTKKDLDLCQLVVYIKSIFSQLIGFKKKSMPAENWVKEHFAVCEKFIEIDLAEQQEDLLTAFKGQIISLQEYIFLFQTYGKKTKVKSEYNMLADTQILSPLNARLKRADIVIMADLNEGSWPQIKSFEPWLNKFMAQKIGLSSVEKSLSMSEFDFVYLLGADTVYLTRAKKQFDGSSTHISRLLKKLECYCELTGIKIHQVEVSEVKLDLDFSPIKPPHPKPPIAYRPKKFSVTKIEKLMRDPYAFYAEKILGLKPLDELEEEPNLADYGQIIHAILEDFFAQYPTDFPENAQDILYELGQKKFTKLKAWPQLIAFWWPRFQQTLKWIIQQEKSLDNRVRHVEIAGEYTFDINGHKYSLYAKADRIDIVNDNAIQIIDYKTGSLPSKREMDNGFAPQLPLEGALFFHNDFALNKNIYTDNILLTFYRLRGDYLAGELMLYNFSRKDCEKSMQGCKKLVEHFSMQENGYPCQPTPELAPTYSDYDHLARIEEWNKK